MTDERKAPADYLDQAHEELVTREHEYRGPATPTATGMPGMRPVEIAGAHGVAFQLAVMAAVHRRCRRDRSCPHAFENPDEPERPVKVILATGHVACDACAPDVFPTADEFEDDGRCDVCETPSDTFTDLIVPMGPATVHAQVCNDCMAFQKSAAPSANGGGHRARWEDALDVLVHLHDQVRSGRLPLLFGDQFPDTLGGFAAYCDQAVAGFRHADDRRGAEHREAALGSLAMLRFVRTGIARAEPVYIAPEVHDAWCHAAPDFTPAPIIDSDVFATPALALFPEPVHVLESPCRAVLWGFAPVDNGDVMMHIVGFTRLDDIGGERAHWALGQWASLCPDKPLDEWLAESRFGDETPQYGQLWRDMQALWVMAQAFVRVPERASRAGRRAAKRAQLRHDNAVTVIRLRRARHHDPEAEGDVDWSCRWIVRGHWRRLHDGRQTYVQAHVKGPDDKPLRVTDRVWEFVR